MVERNVEAVVLSKEYSDNRKKVNAIFSLALLDIAKQNIRLRSWQVEEDDDLSRLKIYEIHDLREEGAYAKHEAMFLHVFYKFRDEIFENSKEANFFEEVFARFFKEDFVERNNYHDLLGYFDNAFNEENFFEGVKQAEMILMTIIKQIVEIK